jgi:hypothetical protein
MPAFPLAGDGDRTSTAFTAPLSVLFLCLLLLVWRERRRELRAYAAASSAASLLGRLPHLACSLLLAALPVATIASGATTNDRDHCPSAVALYTACDVCDAVTWVLCAWLILAEHRRGVGSARSLRCWWIARGFVAGACGASDAVRLYHLLHRGEPSADHGWLLARLVAIAPTMCLTLIGLFAHDTPDPETAASHPAAVHGRGAINAPSRALSGAYLETILWRLSPRPRELLPAALLSPSGLSSGLSDASDALLPRRSPEVGASFASQLSFSYIYPLLALGRRRPLQATDLYALETSDGAERNSTALALSFATGGSSFLRAWHRVYGTRFWLVGSLQLLNTAARLHAHSNTPHPPARRPARHRPSATAPPQLPAGSG